MNACRNCNDEQWVCENHQDTPWETSGHADNCGAGAPCPVCRREMACASYIPAWQTMNTAPTDGTSLLICGGTFHDDGDWQDAEESFEGHAIVRFCDGGWQGEARHAHDEYRWHKPRYWTPLLETPASRLETPKVRA